jgi:hypothetical protein
MAEVDAVAEDVETRLMPLEVNRYQQGQAGGRYEAQVLIHQERRPVSKCGNFSGGL